MSSDEIRNGLKVTIGYGGAYFAAMLYQVVIKLTQLKENGRKFDRYGGTNEKMVRADRVLANFMEWTPLFLIMYWGALLSARPGEASSVHTAGWAYVGLRAFYPIWIHFSGAIGRTGAKPHVIVATLPPYIALIYLTYRAITGVFTQ